MGFCNAQNRSKVFYLDFFPDVTLYVFQDFRHPFVLRPRTSLCFPGETGKQQEHTTAQFCFLAEREIIVTADVFHEFSDVVIRGRVACRQFGHREMPTHLTEQLLFKHSCLHFLRDFISIKDTHFVAKSFEEMQIVV